MRFHILGLPHTVTSKEFNACAYTQKVVKFGKMMKARGHEIIHYGHEDSDLICDEHVTVLTNEDFKKSYGSTNWKKTFFKYNTQDHAYQTFYKNAIKEIEKRKQKNDFLLPFFGSEVRPICDAHNDMIVVEPGIGYAGGHWARWKVFESYAIYHAYCGLKNVGRCNQDWYEVVIPNYFDLEDFEYTENKEDYFLYTGRVYDGKGVNIAIQATEKAGVKLVIAGQKEEDYKLPSHVEYVGYAEVERRKKLMRGAKASFLASMYVEPFGGVQIENLLSGTPTITTDWGSFAENNLHGITGFRCRTMGDFVEAIYSIDKIKPINCRKWGENFSLENVSKMYEKYFEDVLNVYNSNGWYSKTLKLNTLTKNYPDYTLTKKIENKKIDEEKMNGISFILRSRNEAENLNSSLKSLTGLKIPFEVNIILHLTTDSSRKVIENLKTVLPLTIYEYNEQVSRAGYETFITPENHKNSLVTFYKYCFNTGKYSWKFKWDADFFATRELIDFLNSMDLSDNRKVKYRIPVVLGETGIQNEEIYLSNCLRDFKKYLFWEVPEFSSDSLEINLRDVCKINSISYKVIKSYWKEAPWFIGRDEQLENSYKNLVKEWGPEPIGMARASNPEANKYISLASNIQFSIN